MKKNDKNNIPVKSTNDKVKNKYLGDSPLPVIVNDTPPVKEHGNSKYTRELDEYICNSIAEGNSLVKTIEKIDLDRKTVYNWLRRKADFFLRYQRAYEEQTNTDLEEYREMLDNVRSDNINFKNADVWLKHKQWEMKVKNPKRFGDHVQHNITSNETKRVVNINVNVKKKISDLQKQQLLEAEHETLTDQS